LKHMVEVFTKVHNSPDIDIAIRLIESI